MNLKKMIYAILVVVSASMWSCNDDVIGAGASALQQEDGIQVKADTFSVVSTLEDRKSVV